MSEQDDIQQQQQLDEIEAIAERVGIPVSELFAWNIKPQDILYLLRRYPFLQVVDTKVNVEAPDDEPAFITSSSGWTIYDYGNALSASPGLYLFAGGDYTIPVDGDSSSGGDIINPGKGTIVKQAFDTALDMVKIADDRLWEGLLIVDGDPLMQWAAWAEAYDRGFVIEGFNPGEADFQKRELIRRSEEQIQELRDKLRSGGPRQGRRR